jgi:hypothetical protein
VISLRTKLKKVHENEKIDGTVTGYNTKHFKNLIRIQLETRLTYVAWLFSVYMKMRVRGSL